MVDTAPRRGSVNDLISKFSAGGTSPPTGTSPPAQSPRKRGSTRQSYGDKATGNSVASPNLNAAGHIKEAAASLQAAIDHLKQAQSEKPNPRHATLADNVAELLRCLVEEGAKQEQRRKSLGIETAAKAATSIQANFRKRRAKESIQVVREDAMTRENRLLREVSFDSTTDDAAVGNFKQHYRLHAKLGSGNFGTVFSASKRGGSDERFAVKSIDMEKLADLDALRNLRSEVSILKQLDHPNIMKLHAFYTEAEAYFMVCEELAGGDLFEEMVHQHKHLGGYQEVDVRHVAFMSAKALHYLHSHNIIHRDVKPDNMLLDDQDPPVVKLADFGFAKPLKPGQTTGEPVSINGYSHDHHCCHRLHQ